MVPLDGEKGQGGEGEGDEVAGEEIEDFGGFGRGEEEEEGRGVEKGRDGADGDWD